MKILNKIHFQECGASFVEYALLVALVSCVSLGAITRLGGAAANSLQTAAIALESGGSSTFARTSHGHNHTAKMDGGTVSGMR